MFILPSLFKRNELRDFESSLLRKKKKEKNPVCPSALYSFLPHNIEGHFTQFFNFVLHFSSLILYLQIYKSVMIMTCQN